MKKLTLFLALALLAATTQAQHEIKKELKPFRKVVASPRFHVILTKGEREAVRLVYRGVDESKINIEVRNKTLHLFLDNAKKVEKPSTRRDQYGTLNTMMYEGASLTAYITYTGLELLEIRGNQELTVNGPIDSDEFRLRAYGENEITMTSLHTQYFKASLFGENKLNIKDGRAEEQNYKLYGENTIDTRELKSEFASASIFGEGKVRVNSSGEVRLDAFGEPTLYVDGGAQVNKRFVIGKSRIRTR